MSALRFPFGARGGAETLPDPHFVLTAAARDYVGAHVPKDPGVIDVAAIAPRALGVGHHVRRAAYVSASCLVAVGVLCLISIALMVGIYFAVHR